MRTIGIALACLVCAGHGRRVRMEKEQKQSGSRVREVRTTELNHASSSSLNPLLAFNPAAGWSMPSPGHRYSNSGENRIPRVLNKGLTREQALGAVRFQNEPKMVTATLPSVDTDTDSTTKLAGMTCRLSLNIGREEGTQMPADWAASGARFLLPIDVTFSSQRVGKEGGQEKLLGPRSGWHRLMVNGKATFVGSHGEEHVPVIDGAWSEIQTEHPSGYVMLRFYLDFPEDAVRNDVQLPAGRVFFSAAFWPEDELSATQETAVELEGEISKLREEQQEKDIMRGDALQRALAVRAKTLIHDKLMVKQASLNDLQAGMPDTQDTMKIPGSSLLLLKSGPMSIKRRGTVMRFFANDYHILGKYTFTPLALLAK